MAARKYIANRKGTIIYEISKVLASVVEEITDDDKALKNTLLHMNNTCEYCEIYPAKTIDHFANFVKDSKPTENCNDFWNKIPCCSSCNSSKGGKSFFEWAKSPKTSKPSGNPFHDMDIDKKEKIIRKFIEYDKVFQKNKYTKTYPKEALTVP